VFLFAAPPAYGALQKDLRRTYTGKILSPAHPNQP
jgi:hypothetical protein